MDRRQFLGGLAAAGGLLIAGGTGIADAAPKRPGSPKRLKDEDTVVLISDLHTNPSGYQADKLRLVVDDILKMRPLPRAVLIFGDIAYLSGKVEEYRTAREILNPLAAAGISLTFGMGNHDRREEFSSVFPEYAANSLVPDRLVHIVEGPYADIIMLDSLQQGEDKSTWITEGAIDPLQREWLRSVTASYQKPFFVAAHHPLDETLIGDMLVKCPNCAGYLYGHLHKWINDWDHMNWRDKRIMPILCLPSTGHYGDIGYVVLGMGRHEAVARLVQSDFYFPKPAPSDQRPVLWERMMQKNAGAEFFFEY